MRRAEQGLEPLESLQASSTHGSSSIEPSTGVNDTDVVLEVSTARDGMNDFEVPPPPDAPSETPEPEEKGILYYVSSRHLTLASPVFRSMLTEDRFAESDRDASDGRFHVYADDWDPEAFLIVLQVLHLRNKQVQQHIVDLEMLAKIAVIVDYYNCEDALSLFAEIWVKELKGVPTPVIYNRDLVLWIWVAWVFDVQERFARATAVAMCQITDPLRTSNLGLMRISSKTNSYCHHTWALSYTTGKIDSKRHHAIEYVIERLHKLLDTYRSADYACPYANEQSFQCGSFLLGALTKEMDAMGLLKPRPEVPFQGLSFQGVCGKLQAMRDLPWYSDRRSYHPCTLQIAVNPIIQEASVGLQGLDIVTLKKGKDSA
jgi:hypothetical protein